MPSSDQSGEPARGSTPSRCSWRKRLMLTNRCAATASTLGSGTGRVRRAAPSSSTTGAIATIRRLAPHTRGLSDAWTRRATMAGGVEDRAVDADRHDGTARGADRVLVDVDTPERAAPEAPPQSAK